MNIHFRLTGGLTVTKYKLTNYILLLGVIHVNAQDAINVELIINIFYQIILE